ncbi:hypothetical protein MMC17_007070 [Xylographa soralifera]|nr:hypothetical protein [Xylographa soralifera]
MPFINISEGSIQEQDGKVAVITGGSSGIGYAASLILARKGATVHILDVSPPKADPTNTVATIGTSATSDAQKEEIEKPSKDNSRNGTSTNPTPFKLNRGYDSRGRRSTDQRIGLDRVHFHRCDITSFLSLRLTFDAIGPIDMLFANAGVSEDEDFLTDTFDESTGELLEPQYRVMDVNLRAVLNCIKLGVRGMKIADGGASPSGGGGSVVITTSATAYSPEQSLPVYSACKLGLVGLIRSLRVTFPLQNMTINGVAPAATRTALLSPAFLEPIVRAGLPLSTAHHVGLALVYSATASEERKVALYGRDEDDTLRTAGRWNGRVILTLKDTYTELEEGLADMTPDWFGEENKRLTMLQQAATDERKLRGN